MNHHRLKCCTYIYSYLVNIVSNWGTICTQLLDTTAFLGNDTEYYKQYTSRIVSLYINSTFYSYYSRLNNVVLIAPQGHYPCLCLCFGFSQITLMLPFLLMILHFSQIGFTDDLTFTSNPPFIHCLNYCLPHIFP